LTLAELLFGTLLIEWLQRVFSPGFDPIFVAVTLLGNEAVLVGLSAVVYWCFDKRRGRLVTYVLFLGAYVNFFLKLLVPWARPPVDLRLVDKNETSYGFPSGHAQDSATFWGWLWLDFRKRSLAALGSVIVLAVGFSRFYLGAHYPAQAIGGWLVGLAIAGLGWVTLNRIPRGTGKIELVPQVAFAFVSVAPLVVAVVLGAVGPVNPGQIGGYLFGFALGAIAEDRYVRFQIDPRISHRIVRVVIGGAITGVVVLALGPVLPTTQLGSSFLNSLARGLTTVLIAPAVFKVLRL